jgi:hypothetical protein
MNYCFNGSRFLWNNPLLVPRIVLLFTGDTYRLLVYIYIGLRWKDSYVKPYNLLSIFIVNVTNQIVIRDPLILYADVVCCHNKGSVAL